MLTYPALSRAMAWAEHREKLLEPGCIMVVTGK
jgi:hypothetical protein